MPITPGNPLQESYGSRMWRILNLPAGGFDPSMLRAPRGGMDPRRVPVMPVQGPAPLMPGQLATGAMAPQIAAAFAGRNPTDRFVPAAAAAQPPPPAETAAILPPMDDGEEQPPPEALAPAVEADDGAAAIDMPIPRPKPSVGLLADQDTTSEGPGLLNAAGGDGVGLLSQGSKFRNFLADNSDALIMAGMGMMSGGIGSGQGFAGFAQGSQSDRKRRREDASLEALDGLMPTLGNLSPQMQAYLRANPEAAQAVIAQSLKQDTATSDDLREYAFYSNQERAAGREPMPWMDYQQALKARDPSKLYNVNDQLVNAEGKVIFDGRGGAGGQSMFSGNSVEAQALNQMVVRGLLTEDQALQLATGKTVTGPNGEIIFATAEGIFGKASPDAPAQPLATTQPADGQAPAQQGAQPTGSNEIAPGQYQISGPKPTAEARNQATAARSAYNILSAELRNFRDAISQNGVSLLPATVERTKYDQMRRNIQLQLKELYNLGVLNGPDLDLMNQMVFDPTAADWQNMANPFNVQARASASLQQLEQMLERIMTERLRGLEPPRVGDKIETPTQVEEWRRDESGNLVRQR